MVMIVGIDGLRAMAARCGDYRPDDDVPITVYDEALVDPVCNPKGIISATARCFKRDAVSGEWFAVSAIAVPSRRGAPRFRGASFTWNELSLRLLEPGSLRVIA